MRSNLLFRKLALTCVLLTLVFAVATAAGAQTIPAGAHLAVRMGTSLSSGTSHVGETFDGTLANDVVVAGSTVARAGTPVKGRVNYVKPSGRLHAPGIITVRLTTVGGQAVSATSASRKGKSHTKSNATKIGGGAAAGAIIGAIAGGGKGAAIGTLAGGAAGTGVAAYTGKEEAVIGTESVLSFTTTGTSASARRK
jgi:hypothetical protein